MVGVDTKTAAAAVVAAAVFKKSRRAAVADSYHKQTNKLKTKTNKSGIVRNIARHKRLVESQSEEGKGQETCIMKRFLKVSIACM